MTKLMIVESPAKAKTIQTYMGSDWTVRASFGHIRDLPEREMGVDLGTFQPQYVVTEKSKKTLSTLKALCQGAEQVYLATDPDREGEAIAWHLQQSLFIKFPKRITFTEISKKALDQALSKARQIDYNLVRAQECRRVLDRLVGYTVSPALSQSLGKSLSAGRVQSVALRLVVEREMEILNFKSTPYVEVFLKFKADGVDWSAQWLSPAAWLGEQKYWTNRALAEQVAQLRDVDIVSVENRKRFRRPPAPFITSTFQQASSVALKMSPQKCMEIAQTLFDNGWISYHRTDNPNLSPDSAQSVMDWLRHNGYDEDVAEKINTWKAKASAQQGHEAIRVKEIHQLPEIAQSRLTDDQYRVYALIWQRTVACQMKDAQYHVTQVLLRSCEQLNSLHMEFVAKGGALTYPGWLKLCGRDHTDETDEDAPQALPALKSAQHLKAVEGVIQDKKTKASPRYTEASLVKKLDDEGIGRPATYAAILNNIIAVREYVKIEKRMLHAAELGIQVCNMLVGKFRFMELSYTRDMESHFDEVEQGKAEYAKVVRDAYFTLQGEMSALEGVVAPAATQSKSKALQSGYVCPQCQKSLRLIKSEFWGCTGYPGCKFTAPNVKGKPQPRTEKKTDIPTQNKQPQPQPQPVSAESCPTCNTGQLVTRTVVKAGKNQGKPFLGCSNFPKCNHFSWSK